MIALAAGWSVWLLHRAGLGPAWPRWAIGLFAVGAVVMVGSRWARPALIAGLLAGIAGVTAFGIATAATPARRGHSQRGAHRGRMADCR